MARHCFNLVDIGSKPPSASSVCGQILSLVSGHDLRHQAHAIGAPPPPVALGAGADRAYDSAPLRDFIVEQGSEPVIPGRRHRKVPIQHGRALYRERNIVERGIGWFKQCRRLATRFEKTAPATWGS